LNKFEIYFHEQPNTWDFRLAYFQKAFICDTEKDFITFMSSLMKTDLLFPLRVT